MPSWFELPGEVRNRIYEYAFQGLALRPLPHATSRSDTNLPPVSKIPSPSVASLAVSKLWNEEVTPYLLPSATIDFTNISGDPPALESAPMFQVIRHAHILEVQLFSSDWLDLVFDQMVNVETIAIKKLKTYIPFAKGIFKGPGLCPAFLDKVKVDPVTTLLNGYRFDHVYVKQMLQGKWPARKVTLEGRLDLPDGTGSTHSTFAIDLDTWEVRIVGVLQGGQQLEIQACEPVLEPELFDSDDGLFEYIVSQHLASFQVSADR